MNTQMYDPQYVAARLAARRVQVGQVQEKPAMGKRHNLTNEEMAELRELIAGDADEEALGAFAQRYNVHGNSMRGFVLSIRRRLAEEAAVVEAGPAVAQEPPSWDDIQREMAEEEAQTQAVQSPAVVVPPPTPPAPAAPNGLASAPPVARIGTVIEWLTAIRAMRDELREHGVLVEGTVSITVDL